MDITKFLGYGVDNAVSRADLSRILNLPDRQVRRLIAMARDRGELIVSSPYGDGYYLSDDEGELKRQYRTNRSRALSILRQQRHIRNQIEEIHNQNQLKML